MLQIWENSLTCQRVKCKARDIIKECVLHQELAQEKDESIFFGRITGKGDPLTVDLKPKDRTITFKTYTGADMTHS